MRAAKLLDIPHHLLSDFSKDLYLRGLWMLLHRDHNLLYSPDLSHDADTTPATNAGAAWNLDKGRE
jgi:hypothetical protein